MPINNRTKTADHLLAGTLLASLFAAGISMTANATSDSSTSNVRPASTVTGVDGSGIDHGHAGHGDASGKSGSYKATGIHTGRGRGWADASVDNLTVGGKSLGSVHVTCRQGVTHVKHGRKVESTPTMHVDYGKDGGPSTTGISATITDTRGRVAQTVRFGSVSCQRHASQDSGLHSGHHSGHHTSTHPSRHTKTSSHSDTSDERVTTPAPAPAPHRGHVAVTG
ncbi:hypothetical protein [Sciscionella marina]|uniref:hypothetical protein n=1 Tax=Sciscionella marina TaxID=508770 RepID=UPI00036DFE78|nr:hypothetical protein [Sciscionella marina]